MYFVYILESKSLGKYYTGQCNDLSDRLGRHNSGQTPSIKHGIPWDLVWSKEVETRSDAMSLEKKIKSRGARRFLEGLL
jgi:putative endonuclease